MIKAIIFDFDDTLINSSKRTIKYCCMAAENLGIRIPPREEIARLFGLPWSELVRKLWPEVREEVFNKEYVNCRGENEECEAVKGSKEIIKKLKQSGILTGIITSRGLHSIYGKIKAAGFRKEDFDFIEAHKDGKYFKPDPRVFDYLKEYLLERGIKTKEIVYIGDAIYDYQAANGAGLHFIAFLNGAYSKEEFAAEGLNKNMTIKSLTDLPKILGKIESGVSV